jgi:4-amino-4-deoxy-L-arabinose transferase-like glycosyltransferase
LAWHGKTAAHVLLILVAGSAIFFPYLGQEKRVDGREARHAEIAREMVESGEYVVPYILGRPYTEKTPLFNWTVAGVFLLSGQVNLGMARLPSAVAAIAIALAIYLLGRRWANARVGLWSALIWLLYPLVSLWARMSRMDMLMACLILYAVLFAVRAADAYGRAAWGWWLAASATVSLAVLSKGPVVLFFFAVAVVAVWRAHRRRWTPSIGFIAALAGMLIVTAAAWVIACELRDPGHLSKFMAYQFGHGLVEHEKRAWLYLDELIPWTSPWSLFAVGAVWAFVRRWRRSGYDFSAVPGAVFGVCLFVMLFVPNKRIHYLLPILPMWALFLGAYLDRAIGAKPEDAEAAAAPRVLFLVPIYVTFVAIIGAGVYFVVRGHTKLSCGIAPGVALVAAVAILALCAVLLAYRRRSALAVRLLLGSGVVATVAAYPLLTTCYWQQNPVVTAASEIAQALPPDATVGEYHVERELLYFKLNRRVAFLTQEDALRTFLHQPGARYLIARADEIPAIAAISPRALAEEGRWQPSSREIVLLRTAP